MTVISYFTHFGSPALGLTPTARIRQVDDNSLVVTDEAMSEIGDGFYKYFFSTMDSGKDYVIRCDGGEDLPVGERFVFMGISNT